MLESRCYFVHYLPLTDQMLGWNRTKSWMTFEQWLRPHLNERMSVLFLGCWRVSLLELSRMIRPIVMSFSLSFNLLLHTLPEEGMTSCLYKIFFVAPTVPLSIVWMQNSLLHSDSIHRKYCGWSLRAGTMCVSVKAIAVMMIHSLWGDMKHGRLHNRVIKGL